MATTSSIGTTGRDYSTVASWLAAFASGGWIGECYSDSEFTFSSAITGSGLSTSATDYIRLTTAAGQSAFDTAANALNYDTTKGVALRCTNYYATPLEIRVDYFEISKLQVKSAGSRVYANDVGGSHLGKNTTQCLFENIGNGSDYIAMIRSGIHTNNVYIKNGTGADGIVTSYTATGTKLVNCTVVRPSDKTASGTAFNLASAFEVKNCAAFGFTTFSSGVTTASYNAADIAIGVGSNNQASKTYANQFVGTTSSAMDFKTKTGADLVDTGTTDTTNIPGGGDIFGTARSSWDIGAHELVSGGGGTVIPVFLHHYMQQRAA